MHRFCVILNIVETKVIVNNSLEKSKSTPWNSQKSTSNYARPALNQSEHRLPNNIWEGAYLADAPPDSFHEYLKALSKITVIRFWFSSIFSALEQGKDNFEAPNCSVWSAEQNFYVLHVCQMYRYCVISKNVVIKLTLKNFQFYL